MSARPTPLAFAEKIGTKIPREGLTYCADDNTYTPYTFYTKAWACPVALRSQLTCERPLTADELFAELFPDA
jgi:hypothetical protein